MTKKVEDILTIIAKVFGVVFALMSIPLLFLPGIVKEYYDMGLEVSGLAAVMLENPFLPYLITLAAVIICYLSFTKKFKLPFFIFLIFSGIVYAGIFFAVIISLVMSIADWAIMQNNKLY